MCQVSLQRGLTLFFTSVSASFYLSQESFAGAQKLSYSYSEKKAQGDTSVLDIGAGPNFSQSSNTLNLELEASQFSAGFSFVSSTPDYSNVILTDKHGLKSNLSEQTHSKTEYSQQTQIGWNQGAHSAILSYGSSISYSPFSQKVMQATYKEGFFEKSTVLGISAANMTQLQPASTFIDRDFVTKQRPEEIHGRSTSLSWEQIFTERWKSYLEISTSQRIEDRPRNSGIVVKEAFAFSNRITGQWTTSYFAENKNEDLKNERGYFSLLSNQATLTFEPHFDLLISLSYALLVEHEDDPRIQSQLQVASDQYGLGLRYNFKKVQLQLTSSYINTNTSRKGLEFTGGLVWEL